MTATASLSLPETRVADTLAPKLTVAHDNWMADTDRFLLPVTTSDATFWDRWAAVHYIDDQLIGRFHLERALLDELRAFLLPEMRERLALQTDRLTRMLGAIREAGRRRDSARELAHLARQLLDALRLWYAEIELAAGGIRQSDVSREGARLLAELHPMRCGWAVACT